MSYNRTEQDWLLGLAQPVSGLIQNTNGLGEGSKILIINCRYIKGQFVTISFGKISVLDSDFIHRYIIKIINVEQV